MVLGALDSRLAETADGDDGPGRGILREQLGPDPVELVEIVQLLDEGRAVDHVLDPGPAGLQLPVQGHDHPGGLVPHLVAPRRPGADAHVLPGPGVIVGGEDGVEDVLAGHHHLAVGRLVGPRGVELGIAVDREIEVELVLGVGVGEIGAEDLLGRVVLGRDVGDPVDRDHGLLGQIVPRLEEETPGPSPGEPLLAATHLEIAVVLHLSLDVLLDLDHILEADVEGAEGVGEALEHVLGLRSDLGHGRGAIHGRQRVRAPHPAHGVDRGPGEEHPVATPGHPGRVDPCPIDQVEDLLRPDTLLGDHELSPNADWFASAIR